MASAWQIAANQKNALPQHRSQDGGGPKEIEIHRIETWIDRGCRRSAVRRPDRLS
jgi:hypothetical protein